MIAQWGGRMLFWTFFLHFKVAVDIELHCLIFFQNIDLVDAFRDKDHSLFFELLRQLPESLDEECRKKLQNLFKYDAGIRNAMIYPYSNG